MRELSVVSPVGREHGLVSGIGDNAVKPDQATNTGRASPRVRKKRHEDLAAGERVSQPPVGGGPIRFDCEDHGLEAAPNVLRLGARRGQPKVVGYRHSNGPWCRSPDGVVFSRDPSLDMHHPVSVRHDTPSYQVYIKCTAAHPSRQRGDCRTADGAPGLLVLGVGLAMKRHRHGDGPGRTRSVVPRLGHGVNSARTVRAKPGPTLSGTVARDEVWWGARGLIAGPKRRIPPAEE